jgi:hypothetical protein
MLFAAIFLGDEWLGGVDEIHDVDEQHEGDQEQHRHAIDHVLELHWETAVEQDLGQGEQDATAIESRDRKQIDDAKRTLSMPMM